MIRKTIPIREETTLTSDCAYKPGQQRRFTALSGMAGTEAEARAFKGHMIKEGYEDLHLPHVVGSLSCLFCHACVPLRIVVAEFSASANQRKFMKKNADLEVQIARSHLDHEEYSLYLNHFASRFQPRGAQAMNPHDYTVAKLAHTHMQLVRAPQSKRLLGVLYFEDYSDGIYASSQIYDPRASQSRSLGHFGIMKLIEYAQSQPRIRHIYLGSWARDSGLIGYKERYQPLEAKIGSGEDGWVKFDPQKHTQGHRPAHQPQISVKLA